ncbi:MAG TPA: 30S ribosomal protein S20 [Phycisphaerae bacterium]|nr:30S ribosomal protein S20 [Phycisphaerae bacterium]HOI55456.1 30S ribosomal protein S20 [Phycisphaerae bacterium]
MPHTASAKKRVRQNIKRHMRNKSVKSALSTRRHKFAEALTAGDPAKAEQTLREAQKAFAQAGAKGTIHKKTASRKISRMAKKLNALKAPKA